MRAVFISAYAVLFIAIVSKGPAHARGNSAKLADVKAAVNQNADRLASLMETQKTMNASLTKTLKKINAMLNIVAHLYLSDSCEFNDLLYPKDSIVDSGCYKQTCTDGEWIEDRSGHFNEDLCCTHFGSLRPRTIHPDGFTMEGDSCNPTCNKGKWILGNPSCCATVGAWTTSGTNKKFPWGTNVTCNDGELNALNYNPVLEFEATALNMPVKVNVKNIIRYNPGMHHRDDIDWDGTNLDDINWDGMNYWIDTLNDFIWAYGPQYHSGSSTRIMDCINDRPADGEVCKFNSAWLGDKCTKAEDWGYSGISGSSPCIILKMGNVTGWTPDVYQSIEELPADMPEDLKEHIKMKTDDNGGNVPKMVWLHCKCENPAHEEYIHDIEYTPWQGFPRYYFPHTFPHNIGVENTNPIVAVRFDAPANNIHINIECKMYAKNIVYNRKKQLGVIHFELTKLG